MVHGRRHEEEIDDNDQEKGGGGGLAVKGGKEDRNIQRTPTEFPITRTQMLGGRNSLCSITFRNANTKMCPICSYTMHPYTLNGALKSHLHTGLAEP